MAAKWHQCDSDAVFISYNPEDISWAEDELRPRLEKVRRQSHHRGRLDRRVLLSL